MPNRNENLNIRKGRVHMVTYICTVFIKKISIKKVVLVMLKLYRMRGVNGNPLKSDYFL